MQKFFMYLDRYYVKHHSLDSLMKAGLKHFKNLIFDAVKMDVANAMLDKINDERDGAVISRELIKSCVQLFEAMGIEWSDKERRKDWVLRGFRQFGAPVSIVVTYDRSIHGGDKLH